MARFLYYGGPLAVAGLLVVFILAGATATAGVVMAKSGMKFEGRVGKLASLLENPNQPARKGNVDVRLIVLLNDDLRRTYLSSYQVAEVHPGQPAAWERFKIDQRVAISGRRVGGVGSIIKISPFTEFGRRIFSMNVKGRGRVDVVQGLTEITPKWSKVEGLVVKDMLQITWDMRIATSSIPRDNLTAILMKHLDPNSADDRLRIVRFYTQAERYSEARSELAHALREFPDLNHLKKEEKALRQLSANQTIREMERRQKAGQHAMVFHLLSNFPDEGVADESLLKVRQMLDTYTDQRSRADHFLQLFDEHLQQIDDPAVQPSLQLIREDIAAELNINNLHRLADYLRLADDDTLATEQKLALAISGWLLGNGSDVRNLAVAVSLYQSRDLVREYLVSKLVGDRRRILDKLRSLEGGTPRYVSQILRTMNPPEETDFDGDSVIPGQYELTVPGLTGHADIVYTIQLPPEYDPARRYPTVVTLHSARTRPEHQIDWWAGGYNEQSQQRLGQATRHGYIVIAPHWTKKYQTKYEYSALEHAAVLYSLRNACKRFAIDTDRVFLSGHSMGGDAVWDIGLAHPDLWAGVIPIVATADKYVSRYWQNARKLPFYFVMGEFDGNKLTLNVRDLDRYLTKVHFDTTVVEYLGRGHEHFQDEIHRLFEWMSLHQRDFSPQHFEYSSMRSWDNFCWWIEMDEMPSRNVIVPVRWPPKNGARPVTTVGEVRANNHLSVKTAARRVTIWLSPENIDFNRKISLTVNGRTHVNPESAAPDLEVLLEDVRTRGDRQHPFWAKVELRTGRGGR